MIATLLVIAAAAVPLWGSGSDQANLNPDWYAPPAWVGSVAENPRKLPMGLCPFGVKNFEAYRGLRRLDQYVIITRSRWVVNRFPWRVRVYVWCG